MISVKDMCPGRGATPCNLSHRSSEDFAWRRALQDFEPGRPHARTGLGQASATLLHPHIAMLLSVDTRDPDPVTELEHVPVLTAMHPAAPAFWKLTATLRLNRMRCWMATAKPDRSAGGATSHLKQQTPKAPSHARRQPCNEGMRRTRLPTPEPTHAMAR